MRSQIANQLKQSHPAPVTSSQYVPGEGYYCIGGALVDTYGPLEPNGLQSYNTKMPSAEHIEAAIKHLAPAQRFSASYAAAIMQYNDSGYFNEAWEMLDLALAGADSQPLVDAAKDPATGEGELAIRDF